MGLLIRRDSKWWYGRYWVDGKEFVKNLQVEVRGIRPSGLRETGSVHFENSRGEAQAALDRLVGEVRSGRSEAQLAEAVYEARAGRKLARYRTADIPRLWIEKPRRRPLSAFHRQITVARLEKFTAYLAEWHPKVTRIDQVQPAHIRAFLDGLELDGMTAETRNKYLVPIKAVLKRAGVPAAAEILAKDTEPVYRRPYTVEELSAILDAARSDPLMYSLVVTSACTAMRRKDCCYLRWDSVDLDAGFITVKTSKTGQVVDIPMSNMLHAEILAQRGNGTDYVFPDAKALYDADPTALSRRFQAVLRKAGFDTGRVGATEHRTDTCRDEELFQAAERRFSGDKLQRARTVLHAYLAGNCVEKTARLAGVSQSTVSLYLNELEQQLGKAFIRGKCRPVEGTVAPTRGSIREQRAQGKMQASVRDFHSFRTTFVTLALMQGMPMDVVRKITGHQTVDVVTRHYFRPERAQLKAAMQKALPDLLTTASTSRTPVVYAVERLRTMTGKNWKTLRDEMLRTLEREDASQ